MAIDKLSGGCVPKFFEVSDDQEKKPDFGYYYYSDQYHTSYMPILGMVFERANDRKMKEPSSCGSDHTYYRGLDTKSEHL